jgi:hypothetical protein
MKRLIRKILKEELEVVDKKLCDKVTDKLLSYVFIKEVKDDSRPYTFGTVGELYEIYALDAEIDDIRHNGEVFKELGWSYEYDEDEPYDEGYYYKMDNPDDHYDWDEFSMEVVYDWLHYQTEKGKIEFDENLGYSGEWVLPNKDILVRMKHCNFGCGLEYNYVNETYTIGGCSGRGNRIEIMRVINKDYGIEDSDLIECIVESFMYKLPQRISELGVLSNYTSTAQKSIKKINESVIDDFIEFGKKELSLDDDFRVNLTSNGDDIETLANYDMLDNEINVLTKDRADADIIRSIAHEMVHHKQNVRGDLRGNPEEGEDGSPWEDEANAKAGVLVRRFGKINPKIYDI